MKAAMVRARVDKEVKVLVEHILEPLGLSVSEAINLFMSQIILTKGIPFEIKLPNKTTLKTFKDTDENLNLVRCKNSKEMFKKLGI